MRIVRDERADALYAYLSNQRPARTVEIAEGTLVDLDEQGCLLGIEVICLHRDWSTDAERILAEHHLSPADADMLRKAATASA